MMLGNSKGKMERNGVGKGTHGRFNGRSHLAVHVRVRRTYICMCI